MGPRQTLMEEMVIAAIITSCKVSVAAEYKSPTTMEMCDVKTYLIKDPGRMDHGAKEVDRVRCCRSRRQLQTLSTMQSSAYRRSSDHTGESFESAEGQSPRRDGRYGPDSVPSVEWHEPLRVLTPAEGGDGREMPRVAVHS